MKVGQNFTKDFPVIFFPGESFVKWTHIKFSGDSFVKFPIGGSWSIYKGIPDWNSRETILQMISLLKKIYGNYLQNDPRSKVKEILL